MSALTIAAVFVYVHVYVHVCGFEVWTGPFSLSCGIPHSTSPTGDLPMRLFVLLFEGKANLKNTGPITLPWSLAHIEQAPADLKERFDAIEFFDLSGVNIQGRHGLVELAQRLLLHTFTHSHV